MNDQTLQSIQSLVNESNELFLQRQFDRAAAKAEKAYSLSLNHDKCSRATQSKIEFNLATIYTAASTANNESHLRLAKNWLDHIKSKSSSGVSFKRMDDIASLYTKLGNRLKERPDRIEETCECYQTAFEFYAKTKRWLEYCLVGLVYARLLAEIDFDDSNKKKSVSVANKIVAATLYLQNETVELAKIYNDLATIYSKDIEHEESVLYARRLLKKSLKLARRHHIGIDLEMCIYENLSAVCNQLERYDDSLRYVNTALKRIDDSSNKYLYLLSDLKYNEGYARLMLNDPHRSAEAFKLSHQYALKTNQKNVYESLEALATVYSRLDQIETALEAQEKAIKYFESYHKLRNQPKSVIDENRLLVKRKRLLRCLHGEDVALTMELNDLRAKLARGSVHSVLVEENEQEIPEQIAEYDEVVDRDDAGRSSIQNSKRNVRSNSVESDKSSHKDLEEEERVVESRVSSNKRTNSDQKMSVDSSRQSDVGGLNDQYVAEHELRNNNDESEYERMHEKLEVEYAASRSRASSSLSNIGAGLLGTNETGTLGYISDFRREIERQVQEEMASGNRSILSNQINQDLAFEETRPFSPSSLDAKSNMFLHQQQQQQHFQKSMDEEEDLVTNKHQNMSLDDEDDNEPCTSKQAELRDQQQYTQEDIHNYDSKQKKRQVTINSPPSSSDQLMSHYQAELSKEMNQLAQSSLIQTSKNTPPSKINDNDKKNSNLFSIRNENIVEQDSKSSQKKIKSSFCTIS